MQYQIIDNINIINSISQILQYFAQRTLQNGKLYSVCFLIPNELPIIWTTASNASMVINGKCDTVIIFFNGKCDTLIFLPIMESTTASLEHKNIDIENKVIKDLKISTS